MVVKKHEIQGSAQYQQGRPSQETRRTRTRTHEGAREHRSGNDSEESRTRQADKKESGSHKTRTSREVKTQPLIGKQIHIISSRNQTLKGLRGIVAHETAELLVVEGKTVQKRAVELEIDGNKFAGRDVVGTFTRIKKG
jgi:RNase P/RNase MRP subunit p29